MDMAVRRYLSKGGLTLMELLVVIGFIGILVSLLLGAVHKAHAKAKDRAWRLEAPRFISLIQERMSRYYESQSKYPALTAEELHQRGVFDDRTMGFFTFNKRMLYPIFIDRFRRQMDIESGQHMARRKITSGAVEGECHKAGEITPARKIFDCVFFIRLPQCDCSISAPAGHPRAVQPGQQCEVGVIGPGSVTVRALAGNLRF